MKARHSALLFVLILAILASCCACQSDNPTTQSSSDSSSHEEPNVSEIAIPESFADYTYRYEDSRDLAWEKDIVYLAETFLETHPLICDTYYFEQRNYGDNSAGYLVNDNLFFSEDLRKAFIREFVLLLDSIPTMEDMEIHFEIQRIVALLNDAHSRVVMDSYEIFPFMVARLENEGEFAYYLVRIPLEHEDLLYSRLVTINGIALDEVMDMLRPYVSSENEYLEDYKIYNNFWNSLLTHKYLLQVIGVVEKDASTAQFTFLDDDGNSVTATLSTVSYDEFRVEDIAQGDLYARGITLWKHTDQNYWYETYPDENALYFRISKCSESGYAFQSCCGEILDILRASEEPMKLIIDLRGNTGGKYPMSGFENFVTSLQKMTQHQIYILIDDAVGSSAVGIAAKLSGTLTNVVLVGTPAAQPVNMWGNPKLYTMPNNDISFLVSKEYWMFAETAEDVSLMPDITVHMTLEDYKQGVDTVLEYVKIIK